MYDAAEDFWYPYMFRSLAKIAGNCQECTLAGKNLKNMCSKGDVEKIPGPMNRMNRCNYLLGAN